jgi:hypothetical protein
MVRGDYRESPLVQLKEIGEANSAVEQPPSGADKILLRPVESAKPPNCPLPTLGMCDVYVRGRTVLKQATHFELIAQVLTDRKADLHARRLVLPLPTYVDFVKQSGNGNQRQFLGRHLAHHRF